MPPPRVDKVPQGGGTLQQSLGETAKRRKGGDWWFVFLDGLRLLLVLIDFLVLVFLGLDWRVV